MKRIMLILLIIFLGIATFNCQQKTENKQNEAIVEPEINPDLGTYEVKEFQPKENNIKLLTRDVDGNCTVSENNIKMIVNYEYQLSHTTTWIKTRKEKDFNKNANYVNLGNGTLIIDSNWEYVMAVK